MPNFQEMGPVYYDGERRGIAKDIESFYRHAITTNITYWNEATIDSRFYAGDQNVFRDLYGLIPKQQQAPFNFNRIRRIVSLIEGYQRRNRKQTIAVPTENSDESASSQFSKLLIYLNTREGILETLSDSFKGALITGMNLLQVYVDYSNDPISGDIKVDNCAYNEFVIDPYFKKQDLSDCRGILRRSYHTKEGLKALLPGREEEIEGLSPNSAQDGKFHFTPESASYDQSSLVSYDEYYYKDTRTRKILVDTQTHETMEWSSKDDDALKYYLSLYPQVRVTSQVIPTVRLAVSAGSRVFYDGPNPMGIDEYPFVLTTSYYQPEIPDFSLRIQGIVRGLRDAQYLYNRRKTAEMRMTESTLNTGYIIKEGTLVDRNDVFQLGDGGSIVLKKGAQMTDIVKTQPNAIPDSIARLSESFANEINQVSGINEENLGSAVDDKAGILAKLRQGAGLTTLQNLFDALDNTQQLLGRLMIKVIQNNFTPGKVQRIINEEPAPEFYNKNFSVYDCAVEEAVLTSTQKQVAFAQMIELKSIGVAIPDDVLIENLTVQNKEEVLKSIKAAQQAKSEMEQQQAQATMMSLQAKAEESRANAAESMALAKERETRAVANIGLAQERRYESIKDLEQAKLNNIKALSELEDMDLNKLAKLVEIARTLAQSQAADINQQVSGTNQPSNQEES